ncbi:NAD(P)-binding protein [Nocardioides convexus]|uniref:phytoene desaturase family protein n=1 Tax=Nocardioides convexus TaxID=2712224 RepID=UPI0024187F77|nr:NAD(P)-binding protein [Nocardioides convexus]
MTAVDAVVIGAGPNGLVAANALVDAGWEVLLVEANETCGGAVRTAEVTAPGFRNDLFSAFYPLAAASPVIAGLDLHHHGLEWTQAPVVMAHVLPDDRAAVLHRRVEDTAAGLEEFAAGDGEAWLALWEQWSRVRDPLLDALFTPFPPVRSALRLLRALGTADALEMLRQAVLPVHRLADERFGGEGAAVLLTGNAMHSDVGPDAAGSGMFGWLMSMLAQDVGFPRPRRRRPASRRRARLPAAGRRRAGAHGDPRRAGRGRARPGERRTARRRHPGHRPPRGARRRRRAHALRAAGRARAPPRADRRRAGPLPLGQPDTQAQLGAAHASAVDRRGRARRWDGAPRRRRGRLRRLRRRPVDPAGAAPAVRAGRTDDHRRRDPLPRRHRERVGLHPRPARDRGRRRGAGRGGRPGPLGDRGRRTRVRRRRARRARAVAARHRGRRLQPGRRCHQRRYVGHPPAGSSSARCPAWAARRRRSPGSTSPAPRPTRAAGCTARAAGTRPARPSGTAVARAPRCARSLLGTAWSRLLDQAVRAD